MLSFKQNQVVPTYLKKVKNYQYSAKNIFSPEKCDIFWRFWPENWKEWPDYFGTFQEEKSGALEKKT